MMSRTEDHQDLAVLKLPATSSRESSTFNEVIVFHITRSRIHSGKTRDSPVMARSRRRPARTDGSCRRRNLTGRIMHRGGAQKIFAIVGADRPVAAWAIIYLDALYDLW